jgi:hypothetical protein
VRSQGSGVFRIQYALLALYQERDTLRFLDILDKCVLLLAKSMLIYETRPTKNFRCEIIDRILSDSASNQLQSKQRVNIYQACDV